jgi:hypothetical protein
MSISERAIIDNCKKEIRDVWGRYGIWVVLTALAECVEDDLKNVEGSSFPQDKPEVFAKEKEVKTTIPRLLRDARTAASELE